MRRHRNLSKMKEQNKATASDLSQIDTGNISDREFLAMIIKTTLDLRKVEDMRKALTTEIRNNAIEIKGSINKMKTYLIE